MRFSQGILLLALDGFHTNDSMRTGFQDNDNSAFLAPRDPDLPPY